MLVEIFPVVGNLKTARGCFDFQCMCQTNITKLEMMAIGFAVSRDVLQSSVTGNLRKSIHQFTARPQQILKSNRPRGWPVVEKHRHRSTRAIAMRISIGETRIDGVLIHILPDTAAKCAHAGCLVRCENDNPQSSIDQRAHHVVIAGCLWQPHCFRVAPEAIAEVRQAPANLRLPVAFIAQRQNRMTVGLRDRVAMSSSFARAGLIGVDDPRVGVGMIPLEPAQ